MGQKILVAIDDSENAGRTTAFLAKTFTKDTAITFFSVLPDTAALCDMNSPELTPTFKSHQRSFCLLEDEKKRLITQAMEAAKSTLVQAGFQEKQIAIKVDTKKGGIAKDIIEESRKGYDLIVIGRRGVSSIKDYFLGSISHKVLHLAKEMSVLIVS